ncbi:hypothetical protein [Halorhabdus amylolytica]|uniref:hypothetical protein n=1 Tax=Halorhabdus amylolytica TaxID=2559573 RepID=UPI0010AA5926|nr:hypothetical protein [Halorhabdus amylolytica]
MSADADLDEPDVEEPDADPDEDEQPDIEDEEMADFSAVADEIEAAAGADSDEESDAETDDSTADGDDDQAPPSMDATASDRVTPGDIYCNALGMGAAVARASYGSAESDERSDLVEEYGDMARDLQIDEYVDEWLEEQGGIDELSPGQAILISTVMFGGMVAMDDPDLVEGVAEEVRG